jgi:hypothetical protein
MAAGAISQKTKIEFGSLGTARIIVSPYDRGTDVLKVYAAGKGTCSCPVQAGFITGDFPEFPLWWSAAADIGDSLRVCFFAFARIEVYYIAQKT